MKQTTNSDGIKIAHYKTNKDLLENFDRVDIPIFIKLARLEYKFKTLEHWYSGSEKKDYWDYVYARHIPRPSAVQIMYIHVVADKDSLVRVKKFEVWRDNIQH